MKINVAHTLAMLFLLFPMTSIAQEERHIHVNGEHLNEEEIQLMDTLFEQQVPSGFYWLNFNDATWGYEGNDQNQGLVPLIARQIQAQTQQQSQSGSNGGYTRGEINQSQNGSVVTGNIDGKSCTFASVGGTTVKLCD